MSEVACSSVFVGGVSLADGLLFPESILLQDFSGSYCQASLNPSKVKEGFPRLSGRLMGNRLLVIVYEMKHSKNHLLRFLQEWLLIYPSGIDKFNFMITLSILNSYDFGNGIPISKPIRNRILMV